MELTASVQGLRMGRYALGARLATGGMGEVFVAAQLGPQGYQKPVALKLLLPHLADEPHAVQMFLQEARIASQMTHPNIVHVFDLGQEGRQYYIAMELVRGVDLGELVFALEKANEDVPSDVIAYVGRALCSALHHAHELRDENGKWLGLVHRDVSPQNVLISETGEIKLTDFGISKAREYMDSRRSGGLKGKADYLSPEQIAGKSYDRRADVFAAAGTLFHFATTRPPFLKDNLGATMNAVLNEALPLLRSLRPDLSKALETALVQATTKNPEERFPTAKDFQDALPRPENEDEARAWLAQKVSKVCGPQLARVEDKTLTLMKSLAAEPPRVRKSRAGWAVAGTVAVLASFFGWKMVVETPPAPVPAHNTPPIVVAPPSPRELVLKPLVQEGRSRRTPKRAETPAIPATGFLTVDAAPWASVSINGTVLGETPLHRVTIPAGTVTVDLVNPDTGLRTSRRVTISAGKEFKLRVFLQ